jgi:predicted aspartyl protease
MVHWILLAVSLGVPTPNSGERVSLVNGYPFVEAWVNGKGPFRMLLDTGASSCSLSPAAARTAGLVFDSRIRLTTTASEQTVPAARNLRVRVGVADAEGVEVLVQDLAAVRRLDAAVDGVLGQSFLTKFPYLLDFRARRIWFGPAAVAQSSRLGAPLRWEESYGRMLVPVSLDANAQPWRLVLDTGAPGLIVYCGSQCPQIKHPSETRVITNAGETNAVQGVIDAARIGGISLAKAPVILVQGALEGVREHGLVPASWFSALYVDNANRLVRLAR